VMEYPLARAMEDGFVKEPAVVTQRNFDAKALSPEEVERVKLRDGVRMAAGCACRMASAPAWMLWTA